VADYQQDDAQKSLLLLQKLSSAHDPLPRNITFVARDIFVKLDNLSYKEAQEKRKLIEYVRNNLTASLSILDYNFSSDYNELRNYIADSTSIALELLEEDLSGASTASYEVDDEKLIAKADAKSIGEIFTRAREGVGLSKMAASKAVGGDPKAVRNLEKGDHEPTLQKLNKYADVLGYEVQIELVPKKE
jgi:DNA-binding XRE family transcriptional regulator